MSGHSNGTASLWRTAGWRQLGAPLTQRGLVLDVQFSPEGDLVATSSTDSTLALWDVRTRRQIGTPLPAPWTGPTYEFWRNEHWSTVRFSPDDKRLFAVYDNGRAVRWELDPAVWRRHAGTVAGGGLTRAQWGGHRARPGIPRDLLAGGHVEVAQRDAGFAAAPAVASVSRPTASACSPGLRCLLDLVDRRGRAEQALAQLLVAVGDGEQSVGLGARAFRRDRRHQPSTQFSIPRSCALTGGVPRVNGAGAPRSRFGSAVGRQTRGPSLRCRCVRRRSWLSANARATAEVARCRAAPARRRTYLLSVLPTTPKEPSSWPS